MKTAASSSRDGMNPRVARHGRDAAFPAFTVIELLVAVSVLSIIVLALYSMFDQTQRAMQSNATQTDVMEGGRATMELLTRELEKAQATGQSTNVFNFYASASRPLTAVRMPGDANPQEWRANLLQDVFWVSRGGLETAGQDAWTGINYGVVSDTNGVGMLYRYSTNIPVWFDSWRDNGLFKGSPADLHATSDWRVPDTDRLRAVTNRLQRVADGIVHFRVRAFTANGLPLEFDYTTNGVPFVPVYPRHTADWSVVVRKDAAYSAPDYTVVSYEFSSNALPAYVDIELGILETLALDRYRRLPESAKAAFLAGQADRIHLFQQRVPLRVAQ